jgi:hypothetical protein
MRGFDPARETVTVVDPTSGRHPTDGSRIDPVVGAS